MTNDVKHLFMGLFAICIFCSVKVFCPFSNWVFLIVVFRGVFFKKYILDTSPSLIYDLQMFSLKFVVFSYLNRAFCRAEVFNFYKILFFNFSSCGLYFFLSLRILYLTLDPKSSLLFFLPKVFQSVVYI